LPSGRIGKPKGYSSGASKGQKVKWLQNAARTARAKGERRKKVTMLKLNSGGRTYWKKKKSRDRRGTLRKVDRHIAKKDQTTRETYRKAWYRTVTNPLSTA